MVDDKVNDDVDVAFVRFIQEILEIIHCAIFGVDGIIVEHVVAVIGGGGVDGHQPDGVDAQILKIVQFLGDAIKVTDAVGVSVVKGTDKYLIEDGCPPPIQLGLDHFDGGCSLRCRSCCRCGGCASC